MLLRPSVCVLRRVARGTLVPFGVAVAAGADAQAQAQEFPVRAVRMVAPFPVGAGVDILARAVGQKLGETWGQTVIIDNRPGAGGTMGTDLVAKAPRDGYTLLMGNVSTLAIAASLYPKLPYDPARDFTFISQVASSENVIVTHPSLPVRTVRELVGLAKARPGQLLYSSGGSGTTGHLAGELFNSLAGTRFVHVPYKGSPPAMNDLIAGQVHLSFNSLASSVPLVKSGRLRGIATTGLRRNALLPDLPTLDESGYPGFEVSAWQGIVAPAGLPGPLLARLNADIVRVLETSDLRERVGAIGLVAAGSTPDAFAAYVRREIGKWADVVKRSGARPD